MKPDGGVYVQGAKPGTGYFLAITGVQDLTPATGLQKYTGTPEDQARATNTYL